MMTKIKQTNNDIKILKRKQKKLRKSGETFNLGNRKNEETISNIRSSVDRLNITNDPLLPILTMLGSTSGQ